MPTRKERYDVTDVGLPTEIACTTEHRMLPARDGVRLHTMIFFPPEFRGTAPVLLLRSPYFRKTWFPLPNENALKANVIFICQACRGTGWSEGVFDPAERDRERDDAEDLLKWLKTRSWFNGRCAMTGASYVGWTQWAAQRTGDPSLVGVAPHVATFYSCTGAARPGGTVSLAFTENWMLSMHHRRKYGYDGVPDYTAMKIFDHLPVIEADLAAGYGEVAPFRKFFSVARQPAKALRFFREEVTRFTAPAFISGGWFDLMKEETFDAFQLMQNCAATPRARRFTRLTVGPWVHGGLINADLFGEENDYRDVDPKRSRFLYGLLAAPERDPLPEEPAVRYFMLGENRWREAACWPPEGVGAETWYLHSRQGANSLGGDGSISLQLPGAEKADLFVSDPRDPVLSDDGGEANLGCYDRTPMEKRSDVLVYTTERLSAPLTLAGKIKFSFSAAATTKDTDICAVLTDVTPDGRSLYLTSGIIRARYRNSPEEAELLVPGKFYDFELILSDIAVTFLPGHAMRLELCGQHFPLWARNANTGNDPITDRELSASEVTIRHDAAHPARLELPVLKER